MKNKIISTKIRLRGTRTFKLIKSKIDSLETNIGGIKIHVHPLDWSFWESTHVGSWEPETINIFRENLEKGTRYCDIGAWVGPTTLLAAGLGAEVTCFEPDPHAYERLLHNIRVNKCTDVQPYQIALAGLDGVRRIVPIGNSLGQSSSSIHLEDTRKRSAGVLALGWDTACRLLKLPDFEFIKIDIEGGEFDLLPAMMDYLASRKPRILLSTHLPFIAAEHREGYIKVLQSLSDLYPHGEKPDIASMNEGFPSYFFR
jgi:FkbM family methyltransferase